VTTTELGARLGLNVHRDQWPTTPLLKSYAAAGFAWVQVHTPPRPMLVDRERCRRHARALKAALLPCGIRLLVHGPDDLSAGTIEHDRALGGLLDYAAEAGAELVAYHGLLGDAEAEERSLRAFAARAAALGITIAVEHLAPVHPGPPRPSHDPLAVRDLVRRVDSPGLGLLLDVGHAHITASLCGESPLPAIRAVIDDVVLVHVHDNLGARRHDLDAPGVDPLKLDLHLAPGAGTLPWDQVGPLLAAHRAPLMLEVERSHVPDAAALAVAVTALLRRDAVALAA
jgi:sugar phosphate isomerase/epimerase